MSKRELTDKQRAWAHAYVGPARFNASEAARQVGYSEAEGRKCRAVPHVAAYVEQLMAELLSRWHISQGRVLEELVAIGMSDVTDVVTTKDGRIVVQDLDELPRQVRASIKKVKLRRVSRGEGEFDDLLELEMHDKLDALDKLGKYLGMFGGQAAEEEPWTGLEIVPPNKLEHDGNG